MKNKLIRCGFLSLLVLSVFGWSCAIAEEVPAKVKAEDVIRKFSEYLASAGGFRVDIESIKRVWKGLVKNINREDYILTVGRDNRLSMVLAKGILGPTVVCDGIQVSVYHPGINQYQVNKSPTDLAGLFSYGSVAGQTLQQTIPLIDALVSKEPYKLIMKGIVKSEYMGVVPIDGVQCHQIHFTQYNLQWQMCLTADEQPKLRKIVVDMEQSNVKAQFEWNFNNWHVSEDVLKDKFDFQPPSYAERVERFTNDNSRKDRHMLLGQKAPVFQLGLLDGDKIDISSHIGKDIIVLDFWASWCGPCRTAMPILVETTAKYKDKNVVFYAVDQFTQRESIDKIKDFIERLGLDITVLIDRGGEVGNKYGVQYLPQTVVIARSGQVSVVHEGMPANGAEQLSKELESLIADTDLLCKSVTFIPQMPKADEKVVFKCVVANNGKKTIPRGSYNIALDIDNGGVFFSPGEHDIPAGGEAELSVEAGDWHFLLKEAGSYNYRMFVDPDNKVAESDEGNNILTGKLEVTSKVSQN